MSALRESVRRPGFWIKVIAAAALVAAAIFDWTRPAPEQISARLYERAVIGTYQRFVRPFSSRFIRCRFHPTCSQYSFAAVHAHGLPRGLWLTTKRLARCTPWTPMGTVDPVPLQ
ncbi:MAG: membrane protein insertion efficiency factor YidD [Chthoniobacterales bacterium]